MIARSLSGFAEAAALSRMIGAGVIRLSAPTADAFRRALLGAADRAEHFVRGVRAPIASPSVHEALRRAARMIPAEDNVLEGERWLHRERADDFCALLAEAAARMAEIEAAARIAPLPWIEFQAPEAPALAAAASRTPTSRMIH